MAASKGNDQKTVLERGGYPSGNKLITELKPPPPGPGPGGAKPAGSSGKK